MHCSSYFQFDVHRGSEYDECNGDNFKKVTKKIEMMISRKQVSLFNKPSKNIINMTHCDNFQHFLLRNVSISIKIIHAEGPFQLLL